MPKGKIIVVALIITISLLAIFFVKNGFISNFLDKKIVMYEKNIDELKKEYYPMHFAITEKKQNINGQTISGRFVFFTANNERIGEPHSFKIMGNELFFDFVVVPITANLKMVFPYSIFSDIIAPDNGIFIAPLYTQNGYPSIFEKQQNENINKEISVLYAEICAKKNIKNAYGNAVHDTTKLGSFIIGQEYRILVHPSGGIEIVPVE